METLTTRVFNNGNSQAVRIPAEFRLDTDRVSISRNESGDLVIHLFRPDARELYRLERMWGPESPVQTEQADAARG